MGLILPMLLLGLMASLSPTTIVVFVLVLGTARARGNAVGFLVGWGLSLTVVFAGTYALAATGVAQKEANHTAVAGFELLFGVALIVFSAQLWRRRSDLSPATTTMQPGRFVGSLDSLSPRGAVVVGVLKQPWAITTAAALAVVNHSTTVPVVAIAFAFFTVASTATVGLMFLYYSRHPGNGQEQLVLVRDRVVAVGPLVGMVVGVFLVIDGLLTLT